MGKLGMTLEFFDFGALADCAADSVYSWRRRAHQRHGSWAPTSPSR
jgi:hypothetical protein